MTKCDTNKFIGREMTTTYQDVGRENFRKEMFSLLDAIEKGFHRLPEEHKPTVKHILESDDITFKDLEYLNCFVKWQ